MKTIRYLILSILAGLLPTACLDNGNSTLLLETGETNDGATETNTATASSSAYTELSYNGFRLIAPIQSVSETQSGQDGKIVFSLETTDELPASLPAGATQIGQAAKIEPFNFNFATPLTLSLPTGGNNGIENIGVYLFNETTNRWDKIPISGFEAGRVIVSTLSLGYFVVVSENPGANPGGICFRHPATETAYFYTLTLSNGYITYTIPLGNGRPGENTYIPFIPQGTYTVNVAREERSTIYSERTSIEYYTQATTVTVGQPLIKGQAGSSWNEYTGWTYLTLKNGGYWTTGRPGYWDAPTVTYGTGKFQATLTWVNSTSSTVDYDLHLYGPNSLHVYFSNERQGCFELDRDWLHAVGNAIENIYSINDDFPKGEYTVKVHLYGGVTGKEFNCRVLYDGQMVQSVRSSLFNQKDMTEIYRFTVQ
jgi:hypothetical protein